MAALRHCWSAFYEGAAVGYIPKGGTAFGVRMVLDFLRNL
jgi:hypothetical protein